METSLGLHSQNLLAAFAEQDSLELSLRRFCLVSIGLILKLLRNLNLGLVSHQKLVQDGSENSHEGPDVLEV